jgi:hypothetical protein
MKTAIAIYESKNSEKVVKFCTGLYMLLEFCSERQAKRILEAQERGQLYGVYIDKSGKARATYI